MRRVVLAVVLLASLPLAAMNRPQLSQLGPLVEGTENCYRVTRVFAACVQWTMNDDIARIVVTPAVELTKSGEFDGDDALGYPEYLCLISQLETVHPLGIRFPLDCPEACIHVTSNNTYDDYDWYDDAVVERVVTAGDGTIRSFVVYYFAPITGAVDFPAIQSCAADDDSFLIDVSFVSKGPHFLNVNGQSLLVRPRFWREYAYGEAVSIDGVIVQHHPPTRMYVSVGEEE